MKFSKTASDGGSVKETRRKQAFILRGSPIGLFTPVIPTQNFMQSHNPEGYFWHPISLAYFQSQIAYPEKPIEDLLLSMTAPSKSRRGQKIFLCFLINLKFLSRVNSLGFSLSARASIQLTFRVLRTSVTCTLDSHSKTPPSGLDLAQSVECSFM